MNLNKIFLVGRLTRDPESRALPSGQPVSNFGLATNRVWTNQETNEKQEQTEFHNIVAFGKLADICNQYLSKGSLALIEGRIQTRSWKNQDNETKYRTEVIAERLQMGPKGDKKTEQKATEAEATEEVEEVQVDEKGEPSSAKASEGKGKTKKSEENEIKSEDIPF